MSYSVVYHGPSDLLSSLPSGTIADLRHISTVLVYTDVNPLNELRLDCMERLHGRFGVKTFHVWTAFSFLELSNYAAIYAEMSEKDYLWYILSEK